VFFLGSFRTSWWIDDYFARKIYKENCLEQVLLFLNSSCCTIIPLLVITYVLFKLFKQTLKVCHGNVILATSFIVIIGGCSLEEVGAENYGNFEVSGNVVRDILCS
jgi:POT family proton-dependent oligopeptide transporter